MQVKLLFTTFFRHYLVFYVFSTFCEPLGTSTITCMGAHFLRNSSIILGFFLLFQTLLKGEVFTSFCLGLFFSCFVTFWCFLGSLRRSLGTFWDRLGSLWRSRVSLLGACGSSGLFLVSFWYFFVTRSRKGGTLSPALCFLYVFFVLGVV